MPTPMPIELSMKNSPLATNSGLGLLTMKSIPPRLPTTGNRYCSHPATPACAESTQAGVAGRSEEHTSELQSPDHLVCRLLLEKKKNKSELYKPLIIVEIFSYENSTNKIMTRLHSNHISFSFITKQLFSCVEDESRRLSSIVMY